MIARWMHLKGQSHLDNGGDSDAELCFYSSWVLQAQIEMLKKNPKPFKPNGMSQEKLGATGVVQPRSSDVD